MESMQKQTEPREGQHVARSESAKKADAKYKAEKTKQLVIRFYPADQDILEHLQAQDSKQGYIKRLIREDMNGCDAYDAVAGEHVISTEALHDLLDEWDRHPGRAATDQEIMKFMRSDKKACRDTGEARIFKCSECGFGLVDIFIADEQRYDPYPKFCQNCGASIEQ